MSGSSLLVGASGGAGAFRSLPESRANGGAYDGGGTGASGGSSAGGGGIPSSFDTERGNCGTVSATAFDPSARSGARAAVGPDPATGSAEAEAFASVGG